MRWAVLSCRARRPREVGVTAAADGTRIMLASGSPRRRELLGALAIPIEVRPVDTDEYVPRGMEPSQVARRIAVEKLTATLAAGPALCPMLVADTIVAVD